MEKKIGNLYVVYYYTYLFKNIPNNFLTEKYRNQKIFRLNKNEEVITRCPDLFELYKLENATFSVFLSFYLLSL